MRDSHKRLPIATEIAFWFAVLGLSVDAVISLTRLSRNLPFYLAFLAVCVGPLVGIVLLRRFAFKGRGVKLTIWLSAGAGVVNLVVLNLISTYNLDRF